MAKEHFQYVSQDSQDPKDLAHRQSSCHKPNKPAEDPKSYRPISLLCVSFKLLERLILNRMYATVDENLPKEQAGFRKVYSTTDQVARFTEDITTAFQRKEKACAVFVDLTAAYDTIWHRGLALKLLQTIPSKHMVKLIMQMMTNRSFTLHNEHQKTKNQKNAKEWRASGICSTPNLLQHLYL